MSNYFHSHTSSRNLPSENHNRCAAPMLACSAQLLQKRQETIHADKANIQQSVADLASKMPQSRDCIPTAYNCCCCCCCCCCGHVQCHGALMYNTSAVTRMVCSSPCCGNISTQTSPNNRAAYSFRHPWVLSNTLSIVHGADTCLVNTSTARFPMCRTGPAPHLRCMATF